MIMDLKKVRRGKEEEEKKADRSIFPSTKFSVELPTKTTRLHVLITLAALQKTTITSVEVHHTSLALPPDQTVGKEEDFGWRLT